MPSFKLPPQKVNFPALEETIIRFWKKNKIFKKSVESRPKNNTYTFYDGPPFITGSPHYGSLLPSIAKDIIPRYWTMKGKRVERRWGWDCHGLPTENKVEEQLGLKSKKDIQKIGIQKYINQCYSYVQNVSAQWPWYIDHIGRWVDFNHAYKTMDIDYMESVIWVFAALYKKGLIYKGRRISLFCPRCSTPLSNFEIAMDNSYQDVQDPAIFIKFRLNDGRFILAWTTTPWTLPANLALAVDQKQTYVTVKYQNQQFVLAQSRLKQVFDSKASIIDHFKGKKLVGLSYQPLYSFFPVNSKDYHIYHASFVSMEEGTGVVHVAPGFGQEDFLLGQQQGLSVIDHVNQEGKIVNRVKPFAGLFVKDADAKIIKDLKSRHLLFKQETISHSYPFCYRCQSPLIYKSQTAWYLNTDQIRSSMLKTNQTINWIPAHIKTGRFKQGIKTAPHWCLSRSRFWASPIPVWECSCGWRFVPSSIKQLEKKSGQKVTNLHRPDIDKITVKCDKCGKTVHRVPQVLDCWFESGSMPYAQRHYPFKNKKEFHRQFPADYITEYLPQTRGWFYTLHVISNALFGKPAFKNCIVTGVIMGTDGRKMSKLFKNYPDPKTVIQKYGGEALRLYLMGSVVMQAENININQEDIAAQVKNILLPLWNIYQYLVIYARQHHWQPSIKSKSTSKNILDIWIINRSRQFSRNFENHLKHYHLPPAVRLIQPFLEDLSRWYIRQSRQRFVAGQPQALQTLWQVLTQYIKTTAPLTPFITEYLWKQLVLPFDSQAHPSIHLEDYPKTARPNYSVLKSMSRVRQICQLGNAIRKTSNISSRQPLALATISCIPSLNLPASLRQIIKNELNVKKLIFTSQTKKLKVKLDTRLTPRLLAEGQARNLIRQIQNLRKKQGLSLQDKITITAPSWPISFQSQILKKTSAVNIQKGEKLQIKKI